MVPTSPQLGAGLNNNIWTDIADIVLPGQFYSEKEGTYTNKSKIIQYTEIAVQAIMV